MPRLIKALLFFLVLIALWETGARMRLWPPYLIPAPSDVVKYLGRVAADGTLIKASLVTLRRLMVGYLIGLAIGIPLGLLTSQFKFLRDTLGVLSLGLQTLPSVCWLPVALIAFGQTESAMLFIVVMGTVGAVQIATEHGISQIPPIYRKAASTMGSHGPHLWVKVLLPASLPSIVSGTKQGWAFAWRSLMSAEIFVTIMGSTGIGFLLHNAGDNNAMDEAFALMFVIVAIGFAADKALFAPWERFLHRRWGLSG